MKSLTKLSLALTPMLGAVVSTQAAAVATYGDNIALHLTGQVGVRYESNVLLRNANEESDLATMYTPGVELNIGKPGVTDLSALVTYRYRITEFQDFGDLRSHNNDFALKSSYKSGDFKATADVTYLEAQTNQDIYNQDIATIEPGRVGRSLFNVVGYGEMALSPKIKLGTGATFNDQNYVDGSGYTDYSSVSIPFDAYYAVSPKLDVSAGYIYRPVYVGDASSAAAIDNVFTVGVRGEIMPKLNGWVRVGYSQRDSETGSSLKDSDGLSLSAKLRYEVSPLINLGLNVMRDFSVSPLSSYTTTRTGAIFDANYKLSTQLSAGAQLGFINTEYEDLAERSDDYMIAGVSLSYQATEYLNVTARYSFNDNDSSKSTLDYNNNILEVVASLRY